MELDILNDNALDVAVDVDVLVAVVSRWLPDDVEGVEVSTDDDVEDTTELDSSSIDENSAPDVVVDAALFTLLLLIKHKYIYIKIIIISYSPVQLITFICTSTQHALHVTEINT